MKISLNWIKEFTKVDLSIDELVKKIGAQLGAVEEVVNIGAKYKGIVVAKVVSCEAHPNADKLSLCKIDDGRIVKGVERDKDGHVQVVCGAPNVRMGMLVAWIPPGIIVPSTLDKEPLELESRTIRGHVSHGMLASASELGLSDNHDGILEIDEKAKPGTPLSKVYALDDQIIDIENKMFTHRPDCFGTLGAAREIAGIQGKAFKSPDWYKKAMSSEQPAKGKALSLEVKNELPKLVPHFMAVPIANVQVKQSPIWLQSYLSRVGVRPINNIVDLTNYYMLLTGQPLHAYDYDKVKGSSAKPAIIVRHPKKGEKLVLLGGKTVAPHDKAIMIASDKNLIGVGGVMGGADTEVDFSTKNIILECATFDKYSVHKTAMRHGLFTDAVTRFSKNQSPLQNAAVLAKAIDDIKSLAGGNVAGKVHDLTHNLPTLTPIKIDTGFINTRLGLSLSGAEMARLLTNVEFSVVLQGQTLKITPPFWRTDITIAEDIVEEVGRLYGYDHLPLELPKRDLTPVSPEPLLSFKAQLRAVLAGAGANEVLTYSFVPERLLSSVGQDKKSAFEIANAISPDLQYYRPSLMPSLLSLIHPNVKTGHEEFGLFEINKAHHKSLLDKDGLPIEEERLAFVFAASDKQAKANHSGAPYYQSAKYLSLLLGAVGIRPVFVPSKDKDYKSAVLNGALAPFAKDRGAYVQTTDGELLGIVGEFSPSVSQSLKLPAYASGFELNVLQLKKAQSAASPYIVMPKFPKVQQDLCLRVRADVSYQRVADFVWDELLNIQPEGAYSTLTPVDIYQKDDTHKQITLRLTIAAYERTLQAEAVNNLLNIVADTAKTKLGATRV